MKNEDKDKLNQCLSILESTSLGAPLTWLWTWDTIKYYLDDNNWDQLVSEDEAWDLLVEAVKTGNGFSLEYGTEQHSEGILEWMLNRDLIRDFED